MKIIKYQLLKSNKYKITLENDENITLYDNVILNNNLLLTKEINDIDKLLKENSYYEAYYTAIKYLEKKLRSKKEIYKHLSSKFDDITINKVIKNIEKEGYLNNDSYIKAYINDQINLTNNGYYKILRDLKNKGMEEESIKKYLECIDKSIWTEKAKKIIDKMIKNNSKYSNNYLKEKILYDLNNKGYDKTEIIKLINDVICEDDSSILEKNYNILLKKLSRKYQGEELKNQIKTKLVLKGFNYNDVNKYLLGK